MRVAFVINSLRDGGAERVLANLLAQSEGLGHDLHLILLDTEPEQRAMPPFVQKHALDCRERLLPSFLRLRNKLAALKPDVVVSFLVRANVATAIAARSLGVPCVVSERMQLSRHLAGRHGGARLAAARALPRLAYSLADRIIAVSDGVRDDLIARFGVHPDRVLAIPNPYDLARIAADACAEPPFALPPSFLVSSGRLTRAKNFAALVDAYLAADIPDALIIMGKGEERAALEGHIRRAGAADRILLPGYLANPFPVIARARAYLSASLSEGFPNAIAEAMALGVPAVAVDCPSGPSELLADGANAKPGEPLEAAFGILVPEHDGAALTRAIRLVCEPARRAHYSERARTRMQQFAIEPVAGAYWRVIAETAARRTG